MTKIGKVDIGFKAVDSSTMTMLCKDFREKCCAGQIDLLDVIASSDDVLPLLAKKFEASRKSSTPRKHPDSDASVAENGALVTAADSPSPKVGKLVRL